MEYKLDGYLPEDIKPEHWTHDRVATALAKAAPSSFDLGEVDLRPFSVGRHDQKHLGSCVAQSVVKALEIKRVQQGKKHIDLSVLHLYYLARERMSTRPVHRDTGTQISLACESLRKQGVCTDKLWPYDTSKFDHSPSLMAMRESFVNKIDSYYRITSKGKDRINDILLHLHSGNPVAYGTALNKYFFNVDKHSVVGECTGRVKGRHAMCIVGWLPDHEGGCFVIENSWGGGNSWGDDGFFYASPDHLMDDQARDIWAIAEGFEPWVERK